MCVLQVKMIKILKAKINVIMYLKNCCFSFSILESKFGQLSQSDETSRKNTNKILARVSEMVIQPTNQLAQSLI